MDYIDVIKQIRKEKKLTQVEMAKLLNLAQSTYNDIEHRKIKLSTEDFIKICKIFNVSPNILVNEENKVNFILTTEEVRQLQKILNKINDQITYNNITNQNITIGNNNSNINFGVIKKGKE